MCCGADISIATEDSGQSGATDPNPVSAQSAGLTAATGMRFLAIGADGSTEGVPNQQKESAGTVRVVLQQPAQLSGRTDELMVPRIRVDQLHVHNAGVHLREQARVQNLQHFMDKDHERRQQQPVAAMTAAVDELMTSMAGQQPTPPPGTVQLQGVTPPLATDPTGDNHMDTGTTEMDQSQGDVLMGDGSGAGTDDLETEASKET